MPRRVPVILTSCFVAVGLAFALFSFVVRFDEVAVVETFGRAGPDAAYNAADSADDRSDGLHFRWPVPIQRVYRYDRRVRLLSDRLGTQQTSDGHAVVVEAFVAWRIDSALAFHRHFKGDPGSAERFLWARLQNVRGLIGQVRFDQLTAAGDANRVERLEEEMRAALQRDLAGEGRADALDYGIAIDRVGIRRLLLPESVTESVHERMRSTRLRLAEASRASGEGKRAQILAEAARTEAKILEWARFQAERIRTEGESRALDHWETLERHPELAVLRKKLEALRATTQSGTTLVLDADTAPFDLLDEARRGRANPRTGDHQPNDPQPKADEGTPENGARPPAREPSRAGIDGSKPPPGGSR